MTDNGVDRIILPQGLHYLAKAYGFKGQHLHDIMRQAAAAACLIEYVIVWIWEIKCVFLSGPYVGIVKQYKDIYRAASRVLQIEKNDCSRRIDGGKK